MCDFCKERHDSSQDFCSLEISGVDAESSLGASRITIQNVLDQMYYKRNLSFSVIFRAESTPRVKDLKFGVASESEEDSAQSGVTLASCFNGYEKQELLSGND